MLRGCPVFGCSALCTQMRALLHPVTTTLWSGECICMVPWRLCCLYWRAAATAVHRRRMVTPETHQAVWLALIMMEMMMTTKTALQGPQSALELVARHLCTSSMLSCSKNCHHSQAQLMIEYPTPSSRCVSVCVCVLWFALQGRDLTRACALCVFCRFFVRGSAQRLQWAMCLQRRCITHWWRHAKTQYRYDGRLS